MVKMRYQETQADNDSQASLEEFLKPLAADVIARPPGRLSWLFGELALSLRISRVYGNAGFSRFGEFARALGEERVNRTMAKVLVDTGRYRYADAGMECVRAVLP